ncbi:MAG: hypothetical protein IPK97_02550 [Ahniella sp.]|nr:hypothetical protein [Ahniella sp.]
MLDLSTVTHSDFEAVLQTMFQFPNGDGLQLIGVNKLPSPSPRQQAFSLLFAHPTLVLPQSIQALSHAQMGELQVFLVPIQPDGRGRLYEAVFN